MNVLNKISDRNTELRPGTDLQIWGLGAKVFMGALSPQTKNCGWLIDWSIVGSWLVEYGLIVSC